MQTKKRREPDPTNSKRLARMWADFVCIEKRMGKEIPFIMKNLKAENLRVFDAALGSGATSIGLMLKGVQRVFSNEIDREFLDLALQEARRLGVKLFTTNMEWKRLNRLMNRFDLVCCLGNSITCVLKSEERERVLKNFHALLSADGLLIIDERNYPRILEGRFVHSGEYVYCGVDKVQCQPVEASEELVRMEYEHLQSGEKASIDMYPFKRGELHTLLEQTGFHDIKTFGDYKEEFDMDNVEFFTYVARK